jgi:hypothetical protein
MDAGSAAERGVDSRDIHSGDPPYLTGRPRTARWCRRLAMYRLIAAEEPFANRIDSTARISSLGRAFQHRHVARFADLATVVMVIDACVAKRPHADQG